MIQRAQEAAAAVKELWDRVTAGARAYRFESERENHESQLRETQTSLSMMASASDDPDQIRMASEIEDGAEARLSVLLGKAQLTLPEKRERDAIQAALQARRASFDGPPVLVRREAPAGPAKLLGAAAAHPVVAVLLSPWAWLVAVGAFAFLQMGLKERIEDQRDEARAAAQANRMAAERWQERAEEYRQGLEDAANVARHAAAALDAERAAQARAAARERRRNRAIQDVLTGSPEPPEWRLREPESPAEGGSATPGA